MERLELLDDKLRKNKSYDLTMMKYARNFIVGVMMTLMFFVMIIPMDSFLFVFSSVMLMDSLVSLNINPYFMFMKKIFIASIIIAFLGGFLSKGLTVDNISNGLFYIFLCFVLASISFAWELYSATKD